LEVIYKLTSRFVTSALFYQETVEGDDVTKRDTINDSVKHGLLKDALFQGPPLKINIDAVVSTHTVVIFYK
jgi:hypothetical protein